MMKKLLPLTACAAALFVASCASSERMLRMAGPVTSYKTPKSTRIAGFKAPTAMSKRAGGGALPGDILGIGDDRLINVWPFFFRNNQYYSALWPMVDVDPYGIAVRPFFNQEGNEYSILFPLSAWNPVNGDGWLASGYWSRDCFGVFPLFQRGTKLNYILPAWWRRENGKIVSRGVFPIARSGDGLNYILPAWWRRENGETVSRGVFPIARSGDGLNYFGPMWLKSNAERISSAGIFPLGWWFSELDDDWSGGLLPLYWYTDDFIYAALFWRGGDDWNEWGVFPIFWRFNDFLAFGPVWRDDDGFGLFPIFRYDTPERCYLFPLAGRWDDSGFVGPALWLREADNRGFGVLALFVYGERDGGNESWLWTPLFFTRSDRESRSFSLLSLGWLLYQQSFEAAGDAGKRWNDFANYQEVENTFLGSLALLSRYERSVKFDHKAPEAKNERILADTIGIYCRPNADDFNIEVLDAGVAAARAQSLAAPEPDAAEQGNSYIGKLNARLDAANIPLRENTSAFTLPLFYCERQGKTGRKLIIPPLLSRYAVTGHASQLDLLWPLLWSSWSSEAAGAFPTVIELDQLLDASADIAERASGFRALLFGAISKSAVFRVPVKPGSAARLNDLAKNLEELGRMREKYDLDTKKAAILEAMLTAALPAGEALPELRQGERWYDWKKRTGKFNGRNAALLDAWQSAKLNLPENAAAIAKIRTELAAAPELAGMKFDTAADINGALRHLREKHTRTVERDAFGGLGYWRERGGDRSEWSFLWAAADGMSGPDAERTQVLGYLYRYNREKERSNTLCFPFISVRRDGGDFSWSFLYRMLETHRAGDRSGGYIFFIPFGE